MSIAEELLKKDAEEIEVIMKRGYDCLFDNLGYVAATRFISQVMQSGRDSVPDYTEWRREHLFEDMSESEFLDNAIKYAKKHPVD